MKKRKKPKQLELYEKLAVRKKLSEKEKKEAIQLTKGFNGEKMFDLYMEKMNGDFIVMNDLLLQHNDKIFQIDSLLMLNGILYMYEIKNYKGEYFYEQDRLFKEPHLEIDNPLLQVNRTESLLRQLTEKLGYRFLIKSSVVFINPEFTLYQAPRHTNFLLPTRLNRYFDEISAPTTLDPNFHRLATTLHAIQLEDSPYTQYPTYTYKELTKGIYCSDCSSFLIKLEGQRCICQKCSNVETVAQAVIRHVEEYHFLFPLLKITTAIIYDWCQIITSKKRIQRILDSHLIKKGKKHMTYYEYKE